MFEKFVFVFEILAVTVEELCGTNSRFQSFSEKYCRAIPVCDVTYDLYSKHETDFHREHTDFLSSEPGSQNVYVEDFYIIFFK